MEDSVKYIKARYLMGVIILLIGLSAFIFCLINFIRGVTQAMPEITGPGKATLTLDKTGKYTVFFEEKFTAGNKTYNYSDVSPQFVSCSVTNIKSGREITLNSDGGSSRFSTNGRERVSIWNFRIDEVGEYEFTITTENNEKVMLAVDHEFGKRVATMVVSLLIGIGVLVVGIGAGAAVIITTALKKRRYQRDIEFRKM